MSIEKYMNRRGIKLTRSKGSGAPLQQPSVLLVSAQSLHADASTEPAMAEPASASTPRQRSFPQNPCEADLEQEQHQQGSQQTADPFIVDGPIDTNMNPEDGVPPRMDGPLDADLRVPKPGEPMADLHHPSPEQEDASGDEMVRPCTKQHHWQAYMAATQLQGSPALP